MLSGNLSLLLVSALLFGLGLAALNNARRAMQRRWLPELSDLLVVLLGLMLVGFGGSLAAQVAWVASDNAATPMLVD